MSDEELKHYGVKGMHWGIRRTPEQLGRRITRLESKNKKLARKAASADAKAASYKVMSRKEQHKSEKLARGIIGAVLPFGKERARSHAFKATRLSIRSAEFERSAARARNAIQRNERLKEKLNTKLSELDSSTVQKGAEFLERHSG